MTRKADAVVFAPESMRQGLKTRAAGCVSVTAFEPLPEMLQNAACVAVAAAEYGKPGGAVILRNERPVAAENQGGTVKLQDFAPIAGGGVLFFCIPGLDVDQCRPCVVVIRILRYRAKAGAKNRN